MGKAGHLSVELLSALIDGELDPSEERGARAHLESCPPCATELAAFARLDEAITQPPAIACASARDLRSALLDGDLSAAEAGVAEAHLASCGSCRREQSAWVAAEAAIRSLPAAFPSAATDVAMARLAGTRPMGRARLTGPDLLRGLALRGAVAAALVLALVVALVPGSPGQRAEQEPPGEARVLVAAIQQVVLYSKANTLFVLQPDSAAVDALDASTYELRTRIQVGGKPSAMALHESASRLLVLDPSLRSLIEIDADSNTVLASRSLSELPGTPTSVQVDQASGRYMVAAVPDAPSTPAGAKTAQAGVIGVFDGTTKKLETVRNVEVAPSLLVTDHEGSQSLLVSASATTLVDGGLNTIKTLPGGLAGAFGTRGWIAVLAAEPGNAVLHLIGEGAPAPLRIPGIPLAIAALPDGGFGLLLGSGAGDGRIVVLDSTGTPVGVSEVAVAGTDLTYDRSSKRFAYLTSGKIASAPLPTGFALGPEPTATPGGPEASDTPQPSDSPEASAPPSGATASPQPSRLPLPTPAPPVVPVGALAIAPDLYRVELPGQRIPVLTAESGSRLWFLDQRNGVNVLDTLTGDVYTHPQLPQDAAITSLVASASHLYAIDPKGGRLFVFSARDERLSTVPLALPEGSAAAVALAPDGTLWIGGGRSGTLIGYSHATGQTKYVPVGTMSVAAVAADVGGRLWFSDGSRLIGRYDLLTAGLTFFSLASRGEASVLLPDLVGDLWVATTAGEIFSVRSGELVLVRRLDRPVTDLAIGPSGQVWYLAPATGAVGFAFAPVVSEAGARVLPRAVTGLALNPRGRAWLADPSGGFFLALEENRP